MKKLKKAQKIWHLSPITFYNLVLLISVFGMKLNRNWGFGWMENFGRNLNLNLNFPITTPNVYASPSRVVVLNRGAAEPLGAAESSRGAANFWIWLVFTSKMQLGVPPNC